MSETQAHSNDDWLPDYSQKSADNPTREDLREALDNAPEVPRKVSDDNDAPKPKSRKAPSRPSGDTKGSSGSSGGSRAGGRSRKRMEIFDDCPVTPLGIRGGHAYYLDVNGQLRAITKHDRETVLSLFGHMNERLSYNFPQWKESKDGGFVRKPRAFDQAAAAWEMYAAASECGVFNPDNAVRGVGAWTDDDGQLIYHMGDSVLVGGEPQRPGRIGKKIYPAYPPIPHPDDSTTPTDPVPEILRTIETWNWAAPDVHPFITLGMVGVQMMGGALDWRPTFWLVAPASSGKSELQKMMKLLHGDDGIVQTTDVTKSGITSKLGQSSLPVAVDELEPGDERSTKERDIIALARVAASGGEWFRGSADQTGVGGKVYSAFFFSSILIPGVMKTQDVQRLIRLELRPLKAGTAKLNMQARTWRARGARLKRMLIERWPTWAERMAAWRHALELAGVTGRDADNWGTVLAMADMCSQEDIATEDVMASWAAKIAFMANADREETVNDADAMLLHLMGQQYDPFRRGQQYNIAQWVMTAAKLPGAPDGLRSSMGEDDGDVAMTRASDKANSMLANVGLRVQGAGENANVFIANQQIQQLKELFRNSDWAGGVWKQSASRVPGATPTPNPLTLAGIRSRGYLMPVKSIPGLTGFPMDRDRNATVVDGAQAPHGKPLPNDVDDFG
tara:strand:- start:16449 stop:18479 length:2031 start_codon:yes stop_codon:yes gene_type:complete